FGPRPTSEIDGALNGAVLLQARPAEHETLRRSTDLRAPSEPIRVGVIGYGYWGPNLVRNFAETPGAQMVVVSDLSPDRLAQVSGRYPAVRTTTDVHELLSDPTIDA